MGTPYYAVPTLDGLVQGGYEVVAVYTQPDRPVGRGRRLAASPVKRAALGYGLTVFQPLSLSQPEERDRLAVLRPDLMVVAAFGQLLPRSVLDIPPVGCLNVHPSLLPRHRGASPVAAAILAGDEVTGVSIMLMDEGMDTGPILSQQEVPVLPRDTTGSLTESLAQIGARLLVTEALPLWLLGKLTPQPQDNARATYSAQIGKESGTIDWHLPAVELWRRVRAFQPWPGCHTNWKGKLVRIVEAIPLPGEGEPGRVVSLDVEGAALIGVQTGDGVLGLVQLQLEGKRVMGADEFIRGQRDLVGALLPG